MSIFKSTKEQDVEEVPQWQVEHPTWRFDHHAAGVKAAATNKARYGDGQDGRPNYYEEVGRKGGKISRGGGFASNHDLAVEAGRRGGHASRRTKKEMEAASE